MSERNDFLPTSPIQALRDRAKIISRIRRFFDNLDFVEVETPLLSQDVVVDRYIEPIPIDASKIIDGNSDVAPYWLQTSPEFAMKRLLAAGANKIYQITKAFRKSERGDQHNPEFTMLEWYQVGDDYQRGRELLANFAQSIFSCSSVSQTTYADAFMREIGICPLSADLGELREFANRETSANLRGTESKDEILNLLLSEKVEPGLGIEQPEIVFDFPATQSALARIRNDSQPVAERFELYFHGVELANGYHELTDAAELLSRNRVVNQQRVRDGNDKLPTRSRLLDAMNCGLPNCCGVAVGVDRLVMSLLNAKRIDDIIPFPIERA